MNYWEDKKYWKDKVERWDYTDEEWNELWLWKYVDYFSNAKLISCKKMINPVKIIDKRVIMAIRLLQENNRKVSIRTIAEQIWKEKSIRSVQLSLKRLQIKNYNIKKYIWKVI